MFILLRNLDLLLLAVALPIFALAGWPLVGYLVGGVIWLIWRGLGEWLGRQAVEASDRGDLQRMGVLQGVSAIGRGWVLLLGILGAGLLISNDVALAAAVLCLVLFTVSFSTRLALRPLLDRTGAHPTA